MTEETPSTAALSAAPMRRTSARRSARRTQITDRAARMFQQHGYAATSMQQIATAVGLSKASLYYYVRSKDDLLFVMLEEVNLAGETIVSQVSAMSITPLERLAAYLRSWASFNVTHIAKVAVYSRELDQLAPGRRRILIAGRDQRREFAIELVRAARVAGQVGPDVDPEAVGHLALGMVGHMHTWYRPGTGLAASELGDLIAAMVTGGLSQRAR
jgi:AcrR family transcriptional regulator